jgi:putative SOS response-associated peptidase YedK|nr:SOS response-associated peptidase [uncultured Emticicia sp.]
MCYNASYLEKKKSKLAERYKNALPPNFKSDTEMFEIPTYYFVSGFEHPKLPIIKHDDIFLYEWGLIPNWAKDADFQHNTLNAVGETVFEKPSFKSAIVSRRCILPVSGFFEWRQLNNKKYPYYIKIEGQEIFSLACVYDSWVDKSTGEVKNTFSIITTPANELMEKIHNVKKRMPLILSQSDEKTWLAPQLSQQSISDLIKTYNETDLVAIPISMEANNAKANRNKAVILEKVDYPELQLFD